MNINLKFGDTLSELAAKFKTSVGALAKANGIKNPDQIFAGDNLKIPTDQMDANHGSQRYQAYAGYNGSPGALPANFAFHLNEDEIAETLGVPKENVQRYWPPLARALDDAGIKDPNSIMAVLATIKTEVPNFAPVEEYASGAAYEGRRDLGNTHPGDGERYKGRGFIQLTGRANYREYGQKLGIDLEKNPDLALNPDIASKILVEYFKQRGIPNMAADGNWHAVRQAVNGGFNGWNTFIASINDLKDTMA